MLVLFDIDATLLTTTRAGIHAMGHAGRELFGDHFDEHRVEYSGRLDPLIIGDLLSVHGVPDDHGAVERFRDAYRRHLETRLSEPGIAAPCPGVVALLEALDGIEGVTVGLLTGNYPETGRIKLRAAGLAPERFAIQVWASDSPHTPPAREHLPGVAIERYAHLTDRPIDAERVAIIGDTPHDVACALAHGCRALGVATGMYTRAQLDEAGAHHAVDTLSDTDTIVGWLVGACGAAT